ncbi:MAG: DUF6884 domain-containing protein [Ktedonobacterales bacterium]
MASTVALVAARVRQRGAVCRAAEQFDRSPVFRRARDYCLRAFPEWYILSTRHGLLTPQQVIGPGEERPLLALTAEERLGCARAIATALDERLRRTTEPVTFVLFASQAYADLLKRAAPHQRFELPLSGLTLGQRLRWYDERLETHSRLLLSTSARSV